MEKREGIKLAGLDIRNLYRIEAAELEFSGEAGIVEVTGKNKAGKTSLLRSIMALVLGGKAVAGDPRKDDAGASSMTSGRFSNGYTITRRPTKANPKGNLVVEGPDGGKHGQKLVSSWLGNGAFDLHALRKYATRPRELVPILLAVATDPDLPAKLENFRAMREETERARSPWYSAKQRAERTKRPEGERPERVDVSKEMSELERLEGDQEARDREERLLVQWREAAVAKAERIAELETELAGKRAVLENLEKEIEGTEKALEETEDKSEEILAVREKIADADAINEALEPWKEWDRAQDELEEAKDRIAGFNEDLEGLKAAERKLLAESGVDIPGLSFDDDGLPLLHGRPLDAASGREWVEFSAAVAFAHDPELRVALVDEAEGVDADGMEALAELAREKDFQLFLCRINPAGVGEVVICEDGKAWIP